jgi:hypothetical protein
MFRDIDFTEFSFTRHMLSNLKARAPERFLLLEGELKAAWIARMNQLLSLLGPRTVLLWLGDYQASKMGDNLGPPPLLVDEEMVLGITGRAAEVIRVDPTIAARTAGTAGMVFSDLEFPAASEMPGPLVHSEIAAALEPVLTRIDA